VARRGAVRCAYLEDLDDRERGAGEDGLDVPGRRVVRRVCGSNLLRDRRRDERLGLHEANADRFREGQIRAPVSGRKRRGLVVEVIVELEVEAFHVF
jgi:hypothetical protein